MTQALALVLGGCTVLVALPVLVGVRLNDLVLPRPVRCWCFRSARCWSGSSAAAGDFSRRAAPPARCWSTWPSASSGRWHSWVLDIYGFARNV